MAFMLFPTRAGFSTRPVIQEVLMAVLGAMFLCFCCARGQTGVVEEVEVTIPAELAEKWDERENLRAFLQSEAGPEEKQNAFLAWQARLMQEAREKEALRPQRSAEEKEAIWQQRVANAQAVSPEQHALVLEQKNLSDRLAALKTGSLSEEEKSLRLNQLIQEHQQAMEIRRADLIAAARAEQAEKPPNPLVEAVKAQRAQLQEVLLNGSEAQRQQAMESLRATLQVLRENLKTNDQ